MSQAVAAPDSLMVEYARMRAQLGDEPAFVGELRANARHRFLEVGFPTPRLEEWRFTNLRKVADTEFVLARPTGDDPEIGSWCIPGAHRLVLVDGWYAPELSDFEGLPKPAVVTSLAEALERSPELVEPHLGRRVGFAEHPFLALNTSLFQDGAFLWLPSGTVVERPIQLLFVTTGHAEPTAILPRNVIVAGNSSEATIVETYAGSDGTTLTGPVTELVLQPNAHIRHHVTHEEGRDSNHVAFRHASLDRDSHLTSHSIILDGGLVRNDLQATLVGDGAHATLNGLYAIGGHQHVDNQLRVHHASRHCTSEQLYKGILDGRSRAVFNGRIIVDPGAQKTDAVQSNRNLLISENSLVHSNPQLEILADDVRCTHGSTIGRLDEDALFYLRSRGLDREAAESMLIYAFASEMVQRVTVQPLRERLERALFTRLPRGKLLQEAM